MVRIAFCIWLCGRLCLAFRFRLRRNSRALTSRPFSVRSVGSMPALMSPCTHLTLTSISSASLWKEPELRNFLISFGGAFGWIFGVVFMIVPVLEIGYLFLCVGYVHADVSAFPAVFGTFTRRVNSMTPWVTKIWTGPRNSAIGTSDGSSHSASAFASSSVILFAWLF